MKPLKPQPGSPHNAPAPQQPKPRSKLLAFEIHRICSLMQDGMYEDWLLDRMLTAPSIVTNVETAK